MKIRSALIVQSHTVISRALVVKITAGDIVSILLKVLLISGVRFYEAEKYVLLCLSDQWIIQVDVSELVVHCYR